MAVRLLEVTGGLDVAQSWPSGGSDADARGANQASFAFAAHQSARFDGSVVNELRAFYDANRIGALSFNCKHRRSCSAASAVFIPAQETYVGPDYGARGLPRLLFLSLDSGHLDPDPNARTMEALQRRTIANDVYALPRGKHWYQTHALA